MANAYVEKHGGFCLAKEFLKMNELAMQHLATKYALETGARPEDMAAGTVIVSGALMGGQSAWFAYQDFKKEEKPRVDSKPGTSPVGPATQPATGRVVPLAPVPNGTPTQGGQHPTVKPGATVPDIYG